MSNIEPGARNYLLKILVSLSTVLLWMLVNITVGIGLGYAFFTGTPGTGNYIFYGWFLVTLVLLFFYLKRKWKL